MSQVLFSGGDGNGVYSEDCTATANDILKGKTALFNGSDDEVVEGTLELTGTAVDNQVLAGKTYYSTDAHTKPELYNHSLVGPLFHQQPSRYLIVKANT